MRVPSVRGLGHVQDLQVRLPCRLAQAVPGAVVSGDIHLFFDLKDKTGDVYIPAFSGAGPGHGQVLGEVLPG